MTVSTRHTNGNAAAERNDRAAADSLRGKERTEFHERSGWANSAPLALAAFAVCTFMLSMINAHAVDAAITPYVWGSGSCSEASPSSSPA